MSMGVTERITELGILRCIGMTRWQLSGLVLLQTLPLGLVGTILGLPLGLALQWLTFQAVPDYLGQFVYAPWGMALAAVGGIATTLFGAAVPAVRALRISPVEATRTAGDPRLIRWVWGFAALGLVLIAAHVIIGRMMVSEASMLLDIQAIAGIALLYIGCALIVPAVVLVLGRAVVAVAARVLGLRPQLLGDEIARSPFRSAAICCRLGRIGQTRLAVSQGVPRCPALFVQSPASRQSPSLARQRRHRRVHGHRRLPLFTQAADQEPPPANLLRYGAVLQISRHRSGHGPCHRPPVFSGG
jgi:putative ABC transport system permease protein